ncbi:MAG: RipA family octameric membrane protein [Ktedonobacterales bacterium]
MSQPQPMTPDPAWLNPTAQDLAFREYQLLMEGTDKVTDRRQSVNTLFVSINALFLTGVGYLLLQLFQNMNRAIWFIAGFLVISLIMWRINSTWLDLSESNRRLVDLRIRYMKQLEKHLREAQVFPVVEVPLKADEARVEGMQVEKTRGTYTVEDVLYNPDARNQPLGFSRAEQRIGRTFGLAYWVALLIAIAAYIVLALLPHYGIVLPKLI